MINYYIGTQHGYAVDTGKNGKYFKNFLPPELYAQYAATYSGSDPAAIWAAVDTMGNLFHILADAVAGHFGFTYRLEEETGIRAYLQLVRNQIL